MAIDPEVLLLRRRLKRQVTLWRALALVAVVGFVIAAIGRFTGAFERPHIARLTVAGIIVDDPDRDRALAAAARDPRVKALILRVDSPGGTAAGGEALYRTLREFGRVKPVVTVMGELATSAGYMAAIAADYLVARETTLTGSIGVIMQTTDLTGLLGKLGIATEALKSSPLKAVPSPLEPMTPAAREATLSLIRDIYAMFMDLVAERRGLTPDQLGVIADGRVFTGRQALPLRLIDRLGGETDAREWLTAARGIDPALLVRELRVEREDEFWRSFIGNIAGKTFYPERLTLDGLISLWHPALTSP